MRFVSCLAVSLLLAACAPGVPTPPDIKDCTLISNPLQLDRAYFFCVTTIGKVESRHRLKDIDTAKPDGKWRCTDSKGSAAGEAYRKKLEDYITRNCTSSSAKQHSEVVNVLKSLELAEKDLQAKFDIEFKSIEFRSQTEP
jgi:hypothetical protein